MPTRSVRGSKRHTVPAIPAPSTADVPADIVTTSADTSTADTSTSADTLVGIVPDVPAVDVPAVPTFPDTFRVLFPEHVGNVPAWIGPMCATIDVAWNRIPDTDRNAASFDAWIDALNAADATPAPSRGHRYTLGSGSDIARTQNAIYIAFMVAGIPWKRIPVNFGAAVWRFVLGTTKCDYRTHADYFASTFGRFVAHDHNDTPGMNNAMAETAARVWRDTKTA